MRVAKVLIYRADGKVLVLYRSGTHPRYAHDADLPGGIIERGESFEGGLVREIEEEVGLTVSEADLVLVAARKKLRFDDWRIYSVALSGTPDITISWEHERFEWLDPATFAAHRPAGDGFMHFVHNELRSKKD